MRYVTKFPCRVREIMTEWIPMPDGCRLAARLWLPADIGRRVPAVLEYLPYRRRDGTAVQDSINHGYLAGHGFAGVRVDIRGTGDSDGVMLDEYGDPELNDGARVIAWIASQPWCNGQVGMWGYSWGGINALKIAALRPPALKSIIALHACDDRFTDDCHYMGGCLIDENMEWGNEFLSNCSRPPDPAVVGDRWRDMWLDRLNNLSLSAETWLRHQSRDNYWKRGSITRDYSRITAAVYSIGGWADGYHSAMLRLLARLPGPRKGLIGPWAHAYPHKARPGPAIGFLQEAMRWWDYWLNGNDNGIMDEPMLRVWLQAGVPPAVNYEDLPGRWVAETAWPSPRNVSRTQYLTNAGLCDAPEKQTARRSTSPLTLGMAQAKWCPYGVGPDMSADQRDEDRQSICFDSAPLTEPMELLGAPVVELELAVDQPRALVAVRLCDVAPGGASTRVSYGVLNLTHRGGHDRPAFLEPGKRYRVRVQLCDAAYRFDAGHRSRLAVATNHWPVIWPSPHPVTLTLFTGKSRLLLPVRSPWPEIDDHLPPFQQAEGAPPTAHRLLRPAKELRQFQRDAATGEVQLCVDWGKSAVHLDDIDLVYDFQGRVINRLTPGHPLSAAIETEMTQLLFRAGWNVKTTIHTSLTGTESEFILTATVNAFEGDEKVFTRRWDCHVPREWL